MGNRWGNSDRLFWGDPKSLQMVTAAMKLRHLFLGRKFMSLSRQYIKNQRHYFTNKCPYSQSYGFSNNHVWMWELDHEETEHWRLHPFELWCWRRLLRVLWTARRSNQSILKEISTEYALEKLILKLKLQYFGHLMRIMSLIGKELGAGKDWRQE